MQTPFVIYNPHGFLGLHPLNATRQVIRLWRPGAVEIYVEVQGKPVLAQPAGKEGLFEVVVPSTITRSDYKVYHASGLLGRDPYAFLPTFGEIDAYLFNKGVHYQLYDVMGARVCQHEGCSGVKFAVWAPTAKAVSLVGDFNHWDGRVSPMRSLGSSGVWELFIPGLMQGEKYKFQITTQSGQQKLKIDPFGYASEFRPSNASVVFDVENYRWQDQPWLDKRQSVDLNSPINVYEVHLGSWKHADGFLNYKTLAHELADYVKMMGFSHIELLPVAEHPLDESWGYQVTGFYSVTSRYGTPADFQYFVDHMHQNGIGVIVDWVPGHFPMDDFALAQFDGTSLYEHEDKRLGCHPHWNTLIFNYGRFEVANFLLANALFWFDKMHVDGLRVDAVASMIYLDYGRKEGEWIANIYGGKENLEAIEFLKHLNSIVHQKFPKVLMIAEESTSFMGVTHPLEWGGLGFDLKWNMGWMNDTLSYFKTDPFFRRYEQEALTFGLIYSFSERFMLVFSHDEVVHGKASLLSKMPGPVWQKFASLRLLYSYMICQPGKKLWFMGGEIGQWTEWNCKRGLDFSLLQYEEHKRLHRCIKELNHFYREEESLFKRDFDYRGFAWVDFSDRLNSIISYFRKGGEKTLLCIHNFTPSYFAKYEIALPGVASLQEVFSTDKEEYGGSGKLNPTLILCQGGKASFRIAPLATMIFSVSP